MTDRDDFERLLADTPPPAADPQMRTRNLGAAMAAFDAGAATASEKKIDHQPRICRNCPSHSQATTPDFVETTYVDDEF